MTERLKISWSLLLLIAICFIALRGLVVLLFSNLIPNVNLINWSAGALLYLLGAIGLYQFLIYNVSIPKRLKQLLAINFVLMSYWTITEIIVGDEYTVINNVFLLLGLAPFSIILLKELSEKSISIFLVIITAMISLSVIYDFAQLNDFFGMGNWDAVTSRYGILYPSLDGLGKSNNLYRPIGLWGPLPHNASQINSMLAVYWFMQLFSIKTKRYFMIALGLFACSFSAVILALVVSNIIAMFVGLAMGTIIGLKFHGERIFKLWPIALTVAVIIIAIVWLYELSIPPQLIDAVTLRADSETGDWDNMLDWRTGSFVSDSLSFIFGHDALVGSRIGTLEIGMLGLVFQFGILAVLPFYYLMTYPIVNYATGGIRSPLKQQCIPEILALLTGFLTLWHYRSLLQTPNMIIFFVIYTSAVVKSRPALQEVKDSAYGSVAKGVQNV